MGSSGGPPSSPPPGNVQSWIQQAIQILEQNGVPASALNANDIWTIIQHESGGNPNAISPTDDFGLWQINGSHGSMATLNPAGNARSAVSISSDGRNWGPWTTYTSGAYRGKC